MALAGLHPADVAVEVVVGRVDEADELSDAVTVPMKHVGESDGVVGEAAERFEAAVQLPHAGLTGYTVRVLPTTRCWRRRWSWGRSCWRADPAGRGRVPGGAPGPRAEACPAP